MNIESRDNLVRSLNENDYLLMFQNWCLELSTKLTTTLPTLDNEDSLKLSCSSVVLADSARAEAQKERDEISKQDPVDQDALDKANEALSRAEAQLQDRISDAQEIANQVFQKEDFQNLLSDSYDDNDLITYTVLAEATPEKLAKWCDDDPNQAKEILDFLHDIYLMRTFVQSGGARKGEYPLAVQIYNRIKPCQSNPVLCRIALAVALELSYPCPHFNIPNLFVDPFQRYIHFEQAYLLGELDPNFCRFNVWEMRQIVNCDATEDELGWGRQCLLNYRPDIAYSDEPQWQYCYIVRTDVSYNDPVWYKSPPSYDQILSGGGKCGPRAWYGRFICKLFGIPTWGVTQPGHAAMTRWTINGWCTCLGAGFEYSDWEGECGLNFQLTTQAMQSCVSEESFATKVRRLEWVAAFQKEDSTSVRSHFIPNPDSLWWSLSFFQRQKLVSSNSKADVFMHPHIDQKHNFRLRINDVEVDDISIRLQGKDNGTILIPAVSCSSPQQSTQDVRFMKSFLGGQQLFISGGGSVEYTVKPPILSSESISYNLTCLLCTVHRIAEPLTLIIVTDDVDGESTSIELPYTKGMWAETCPVKIKIGGPHVKQVVLKIIRTNELFGFSMKEIKLTKG